MFNNFTILTEGDNIEILRKFWNTLLSLILTIEIILVILFAVPNLFQIKPYIVTSGSMEPDYPVGSLIYVKKADVNTIKVGDVITFYMTDSDIVATHEVYEIDTTNKEFRTQGINNVDEDGNIIHDANPVSFDNLIGTPIYCIPYLGYINKYITKSPGLYIVIGITLFVVIMSFLFEKKEKEK